MSFQSAVVRVPLDPHPREASWRRRGGRRGPLDHLSWRERYWSARLTQGTAEVERARKAARRRRFLGEPDDSAAYQVWLYDHR